MIGNILAIGAVIGGIIGLVAYLPQFWHVIRVKDSTGLSLIAWYAWLLGDSLLLIYSISIKNPPYIIVNSLYCFAGIVMLILAYKYKKP